MTSMAPESPRHIQGLVSTPAVDSETRITNVMVKIRSAHDVAMIRVGLRDKAILSASVACDSPGPHAVLMYSQPDLLRITADALSKSREVS